MKSKTLIFTTLSLAASALSQSSGTESNSITASTLTTWSSPPPATSTVTSNSLSNSGYISDISEPSSYYTTVSSTRTSPISTLTTTPSSTSETAAASVNSNTATSTSANFIWSSISYFTSVPEPSIYYTTLSSSHPSSASDLTTASFISASGTPAPSVDSSSTTSTSTSASFLWSTIPYFSPVQEPSSYYTTVTPVSSSAPTTSTYTSSSTTVSTMVDPSSSTSDASLFTSSTTLTTSVTSSSTTTFQLTPTQIICPAGSRLAVSGKKCVNCAAGSISAKGTTGSCTICPVGTYSAVDRTTCGPCAPNTYLKAKAKSCKPCTGEKVSSGRSAVCINHCTGSTTLTLGALTGIDMCTPCPYGAVACTATAFSADQVIATSCLAGFYLNEGACYFCPFGSSSNAGSEMCTLCDSKYATRCTITDSGDSIDSACKSNFYLNSKSVCTSCLKGTGSTYDNSDPECRVCSLTKGVKSCDFNVHPTNITSCLTPFRHSLTSKRAGKCSFSKLPVIPLLLRNNLQL